MIYTVTLNPSIDYIVHADHLKMGEVNRMTKDLKLPGGKGINVSRILHRLQTNTTAWGFLGGFTGNFIDDWLKQEGVQTDFTKISQDTRINVKLKSDLETEINGLGPTINEEEIQRFLEPFDQLTKEDLVVLAGSIPKSLSTDFYEKLIKKIIEKDAQFVIDTTGDALLAAVPYHPLVIKPNKDELSEMYNTSISSIDELVYYGKKLLNDGAQHVIISMAGDGALLFTNEGVYRSNVLKRSLKNSVGAGDSMIAGFVGRYKQTNDPIDAFVWGVACGSATAFSDDLAQEDLILELVKEVKITKIEENENEN